MLHRLAAPHNSLVNTATSVPPPPVIGSKEEHLIYMPTMNPQLTHVIKLLLLNQFKKKETTDVSQ